MGVRRRVSWMVMVSPAIVNVPHISRRGALPTTWNVPSALIVHTVPSALVHVPASAAGPEGVVAQAVTSDAKAAAAMTRKPVGIFMHPCCPGAVRSVKPLKSRWHGSFFREKDCHCPGKPITREHGGASCIGYCCAEVRLVAAKLEMVRTRRVLEHGHAHRRFYRLGRPADSQQREINGRLQRRADSRPNEPGCDRSAWLSCEGRPSGFRQHKCEQGIGRNQPRHPDFGSQRQGNTLRLGNEIAWPVAIFRAGGGSWATGERIDLLANPAVRTKP